MTPHAVTPALQQNPSTQFPPFSHGAPPEVHFLPRETALTQLLFAHPSGQFVVEVSVPAELHVSRVFASAHFLAPGLQAWHLPPLQPRAPAHSFFLSWPAASSRQLPPVHSWHLGQSRSVQHCPLGMHLPLQRVRPETQRLSQG